MSDNTGKANDLCNMNSEYLHIDGPHRGEVCNTSWPEMTEEREARAQASGGVLRWLVERTSGEVEDFDSLDRTMYWTHWLNGKSVLSVSREPLSKVEIGESAEFAAAMGLMVIENSMRPMGPVNVQH